MRECARDGPLGLQTGQYAGDSLATEGKIDLARRQAGTVLRVGVDGFFQRREARGRMVKILDRLMQARPRQIRQLLLNRPKARAA